VLTLFSNQPQQRQTVLPMDFNHINHLFRGIQAASHEKKHPKIAGLILMVIGFFFVPMLIGIPMMIYGFYKLVK
jgi:hypothetical protein